MKVLKFGGTSVGSVQSIQSLIDIVKKERLDKPIVVLSAMSGITNLLFYAAEEAASGKEITTQLEKLQEKHFSVVKTLLSVQLQNPVLTKLKLFFNELEDILQGVSSLQELTPKTRDLILSYGERCSTYMISKIAEQYFPEALFVDTTELIKTDSHFGGAHVNTLLTEVLIRNFHQANPDKLLFVTGFIASNDEGKITTLGRGGSDYTAAIWGAALNASEIQIWTDVNGMMTADPRIVKKAFSLPELSYIEAMELSYFGAKVIYPPNDDPSIYQKNPHHH